jgi:hypothetical protein
MQRADIELAIGKFVVHALTALIEEDVENFILYLLTSTQV